MSQPTYIYRRPDTGSFLFRWVVPTFLRAALGGKREIRRTLETRDKRQALEAARQLSVLLDRGALLLAKQDTSKPGYVMHALLKYIEQFAADGKLISRTTVAHVNPNKLEQEEKALQLAVRALGLKPGAASEATATGMTLAELVAAYFAERVRTKPLTAKTRQEVESTFSLMTEVLGEDAPVSELTRQDFSRFKEILQRLPKNKTKDARWRDHTVQELAVMSLPASELLTARTLNKNWDRVTTLFKWATLNGHVKDNYAEGMRFAEPARKRENPKREPYTDKQIQTLLDFLLTDDYDADTKPWRKWVPLLGFYTGARLNEVCQLHVSDFIEVEGVPCINITDEGDSTKRLKNENSRRLVPVHPELVRLGLLDYVNDLKGKGVARLFSQLSAGRDGYGKNVSRWYGELMEKLKISRDFHAIRHNVVNQLREARVEEDRIADIVGHSRSSKITLSTYARALSVKAKAEAIAKLRYGAEVVPINSSCKAA